MPDPNNPYVHPSIIDPSLATDREAAAAAYERERDAAGQAALRAQMEADIARGVPPDPRLREEVVGAVTRAPMEALYPPPELVDAVRRYHVAQREDLLRRVAEIESLLGFVQVADELAVRVSKLEAFTGVNQK